MSSKRCSETEEFNLATAGTLYQHIRMDDREVVLRYCAYRLLGINGYVQAGSIDAFLESTTAMLDDPVKVPDSVLDQLFEDFRAAMMKSYDLFGEHAFRKWPRDTTTRRPISRPLFETWAVVLSDFSETDLRNCRDAIVEAARDLMTDDRAYIDAITAGTGGVAKVKLRFSRTEEAARVGL
jgi:hypothetical protein